MKILHLTLLRKWFDAIASGKKTREYREIKPYWAKRLDAGRTYDEVWFRNGYNKGMPFMRVQWKGITTEMFEGVPCYAILLGKILEIRNYDQRSTTLTVTIPCNGFSSRTGKRVGVRHRWNGGFTCIWCGRFKDAIHTEIKAKP